MLALASSYPVYLTLGQGQFDLLWPLAAALFTSSMECSERLRNIPRAAVAALIFAIKPDLFIAFLAPVVAGWRRAPVRVVVATLLILGAATAVILGPAGLGDVVHIELYTIAKRFPPSLDMTVVGLFYRVLGPGRATSVIGIAAIPLGVGGLGWAWHRNPPRTRVDWWLAVAATCRLSLLISPHDLVQGLLLLAAPALLVAKALRASGRSLLPLAGWILAFDLVTLVDMSPHLCLPVRLTPILLLIATFGAWRLRGRIGGGETADRRPPEPTSSGIGGRPSRTRWRRASSELGAWPAVDPSSRRRTLRMLAPSSTCAASPTVPSTRATHRRRRGAMASGDSGKQSSRDHGAKPVPQLDGIRLTHAGHTAPQVRGRLGRAPSSLHEEFTYR